MTVQTQTTTASTPASTAASEAALSLDVVRELDLEEFGQIHGVTCDDAGQVWFAYGDGGLACVEPASGRVVRHFEDCGATAGTAFDGTHLWQITDERIVRMDPATGEVVHAIPQPEGHCAGMAWAEGALWVGAYADQRILKIDPDTGEVLKTLEADRLVTGVTWLGEALWIGAWKQSDAPWDAELQRLDQETGRVLERHPMAGGTRVSGLGADDGKGLLWCGGCAEGGVSAVRVAASA